MSAKPKREEQPEDNKVDLFIAPYQQEYSEAITAAREAAETTATPAWQSNYRANIDEHRKSIKYAVESIEVTCGRIEASDTYEEAEKDISKAVKSLAEERVRFSAWRSRAVRPYETTAQRCQEIIATATRRASDDERNNPLLSIGLVLGVHERLKTWPTAEWNDEAGAVVVVEPV